MPRIVVFHKTGGPEVLQIEETPLQEPGPGEVRLKVEAFGLNRAETLFRQALYLERPKLPSRLGYEAAGVVDAVGPDVGDVQVGDRVSTIPAFSMRKYGVYGETAIVPAAAVTPYPDDLSAAEGAAIWMQYLTAYGGLATLGGLNKSDTVVITAASSSVGVAAIQIAKRIGATVVATTRGPAKREALLDAGADHVVTTSEENVGHKVKELTEGRGARLIFDAVAGSLVEKLARAAAPRGIIIIYGALGLEPTPFPLADALSKGLSVRGYTLFEITSQPDKLQEAKDFIFQGLQAGALKPVIARTFALEEVAAAHRYMESNQQIGKIVVTV